MVEPIVESMTTTIENAESTLTDTLASDDLVARARSLSPILAEHAARHDIEGNFVTEALNALREAGLLRAAVPVELGGDGASISDLAAIQRELARHCGSPALATAMHQHGVAFTAWRDRRGLRTKASCWSPPVVVTSPIRAVMRSRWTAATGSAGPNGSPASRRTGL